MGYPACGGRLVVVVVKGVGFLSQSGDNAKSADDDGVWELVEALTADLAPADCRAIRIVVAEGLQSGWLQTASRRRSSLTEMPNR